MGDKRVTRGKIYIGSC